MASLQLPYGHSSLSESPKYNALYSCKVDRVADFFLYNLSSYPCNCQSKFLKVVNLLDVVALALISKLAFPYDDLTHYQYFHLVAIYAYISRQSFLLRSVSCHILAFQFCIPSARPLKAFYFSAITYLHNGIYTVEHSLSSIKYITEVLLWHSQ